MDANKGSVSLVIREDWVELSLDLYMNECCDNDDSHLSLPTLKFFKDPQSLGAGVTKFSLDNAHFYPIVTTHLSEIRIFW